jgi:hypothetical protein
MVNKNCLCKLFIYHDKEKTKKYNYIWEQYNKPCDIGVICPTHQIQYPTPEHYSNDMNSKNQNIRRCAYSTVSYNHMLM